MLIRCICAIYKRLEESEEQNREFRIRLNQVDSDVKKQLKLVNRDEMMTSSPVSSPQASSDDVTKAIYASVNKLMGSSSSRPLPSLPRHHFCSVDSLLMTSSSKSREEQS